jgi:hypothetical protein
MCPRSTAARWNDPRVAVLIDAAFKLAGENHLFMDIILPDTLTEILQPQ